MGNNFRNIYINFNCKVDETVRYQCRSSDGLKSIDKEIFFIGDKYFYFLFNKNGKTFTFSLRDISKEEYYVRKAHFFDLRPNGRFGKFRKAGDDNEYFIACFKDTEWKKNMPLSDCILEAPSALKEVYDSVKADLELKRKIAKENEAFAKKEHARMCSALGLKTGVAYENVLRIGVDEAKVRAFKASYNEAIEKVKTMSLGKLRELQINLFRNSRSKRKEAMEELGIKFFEADVKLLVLSELEAYIEKTLKDYAEESINIAIQSAIDMPYHERRKVYDILYKANRGNKRMFLNALNVEADAIDLKSYPLAKIKKEIEASLGMEVL